MLRLVVVSLCCLYFDCAGAFRVAFERPFDGFVVRSPSFLDRPHEISLYLLNECAVSPKHALTVHYAGFAKREQIGALLPSRNLSCLVSVIPVTQTVDKARPYLDVLVYGDADTLQSRSVCVSVFATFGEATVAAACALSAAVDQPNACVARLHLPARWWLWAWHGATERKTPRRYVHVRHAVAVVDSTACAVQASAVNAAAARRVELVADAALRNVTLEQTADWVLLAMLPQLPVSPNTLFPVFVHIRSNTPILDQLYLLKVRFIFDTGLTVFTIDSLADSMWSVESTISANKQLVTVSCALQNALNKSEGSSGALFAVYLQTALEFNDEKSTGFSWSVRYAVGAEVTTTESPPANVSRNETGQVNAIVLQVVKDTAYALVPVTAASDLVNTAVLTGRTYTRRLRVYTVTHAAAAHDVTLQSSCDAAEHTVLKVAPGCSALLLDGSESRGAVNATVHVNFSTFSATLSQRVWYPDLPLTVWLSDPVLNAVAGWQLRERKKLFPATLLLRRRQWGRARRRRARAQQTACRLRFQEAEVRVYTRFRADERRSGRSMFLGGMGRQLQFDVTALAAEHVRVQDAAVARVGATSSGVVVVSGANAGATDVRLVAPLLRLVLGSAQLQVTHEEVVASAIVAAATTDLRLTLADVDGFPTKKLSIYGEHVFTSKYQMGDLSVKVTYSDGATTDLADIPNDDYDFSFEPRYPGYLRLRRESDGRRRLLALDDAGGGVFVDLQLRGAAECRRAEFIVDGGAYVELNFGGTIPPPAFIGRDQPPFANGAQHYPPPLSIETVRIDEENSALKHAPANEARRGGSFLLAVALVAVGVFTVVAGAFALNQLAVGRATGRGYKFNRLVPRLPQLGARDGSSGGGPASTACEEWVWLSKDQLEGNATGSIGSRYSRDSTLAATVERRPHVEPSAVVLRSSSVDSSHRSVSYRGSEVSIYISPQPGISVRAPLLSAVQQRAVQVHDSHYADRRSASWNNKSRARVRVTPNPMGADSSSEQNLSRLTTYKTGGGQPATARSDGDVQWDSVSLGLDETELRHYFSTLRETIA